MPSVALRVLGPPATLTAARERLVVETVEHPRASISDRRIVLPFALVPRR